MSYMKNTEKIHAKRGFAFLLTLCLIALMFCFTGCNSSQGEEADQADEEKAAAETKARTEKLYDDFIKGTGRALYTGQADRAVYLTIGEDLTAGKAYTLEEIMDAARYADQDTVYSITKGPEFQRIDCGQDGNEELLLTAFLNEEFTLYMVLKDIDGVLTICYDQDGWSRSDVTVEEDGKIISGGSGGAAVHYTDYAYLDADGNYKYYYGIEHTLTLFGDVYVFTRDNEFQMISAEKLDGEHLGFSHYYFDPGYMHTEHYYVPFAVDDDYNEVEHPEKSSALAQLKDAFKKIGVKTYTQEEVEKILEARAEKIGYPKGK